MRRFKALAAKHRRLCETCVTESAAARDFEVVKIHCDPQGCVYFLIVSRVREPSVTGSHSSSSRMRSAELRLKIVSVGFIVEEFAAAETWLRS